MQAQVAVQLVPQGPWCDAILTTEHAASSFGQPVVVVEGEQNARGPGEVDKVRVSSLVDADIVDAAVNAGFHVVGIPSGRRQPAAKPERSGRKISLHPLDVGFDLRATDTPVHIEGITEAIYLDQDGNKRTASGTPDQIAAELRRAGFTVKFGEPIQQTYRVVRKTEIEGDEYSIVASGLTLEDAEAIADHHTAGPDGIAVGCRVALYEVEPESADNE